MKKLQTISLVVTTALSMPLQAENRTGYWVDSWGELVRTHYGHCWRNSSWTTENSLDHCEGIKKEAPMKEETPADSDNDGITDNKDNCPTTAAGIMVDANGCAKDSDNDGIIDSNDKCPATVSGVNVDASGCVIIMKEADSDADGVVDSKDNCPNTLSTATVDAKGCAIVMDDDNDGIINSLDKCDNTASGVAVNKQGCELKSDISLSDVQFKSGTADLDSNSKNKLDGIATTLKDNQHLNFEVAGHTDSRGNSTLNTRLSEARADSVRRYLVYRGVSSSRLSAKGYGSDKPIASNDTREGRSQNRRVELILK